MPAFAESYDLSPDLARADFEGIVLTAAPGDTVNFPSGKSFMLAERLGKGQNTVVFAIAGMPNLVLRLPLDNTSPLSEDFYFGARALAADGVPIVQALDHEPGLFVVAERLEKEHYTLESFLRDPDFHPQAEKRKMLKSLREFIAATAQYAEIEDLHMDNLVYEPNKNRWIVADIGRYSSKVIPSRPFESIVERLLNTWVMENEVFEPFNIIMAPAFDEEFIESLRSELTQVVVEARARWPIPQPPLAVPPRITGMAGTAASASCAARYQSAVPHR